MSGENSWSDKDYDSISWHDCCIYSINFEEDKTGSCNLSFCLDFILKATPKRDGRFSFIVAPAILRFFDVDDFACELNLAFGQSLDIFLIEKSESKQPDLGLSHWKIECQTYGGPKQNIIEFEASGFSQNLVGAPVRSKFPCLNAKQRNSTLKKNT